MIYTESGEAEHEPPGGVTKSSVSAYDARWRFLGDRADADVAYCLRFGVTQAPDPYVTSGNTWSYALPTIEAPR